ncbi:MAG: hypothetical protein LBN06_12820 [Prevotellaceae bacterium]|jgi:uncharacterized membrane protein YbjE (DUF340 family)|nr:hypothetical protein [Prevotellaceae bacterium]
MELEDLKKSWHTLDDKLQQTHVTDEQQLSQLIAGRRANTRRSIGRLASWQRIGMWISALIVIPICLDTAISSQWRGSGAVMALFYAVTFVLGMVWDYLTLRLLVRIKPDEMSVIEVATRMARYRRYIRSEIYVGCAWLLLFFGLEYWHMRIYDKPWGGQLLFLLCLVGVTVGLVYLLYKKFVYKHLDTIDKNIDELKDVCTD